MTSYYITAVLAVIVFAFLGFASLPFKTTRKRRQQDPSNRGTPPDLAAVLTVVATKLRVTMPTEFSQNGIPQYGITGGAHVGTELPTAITLISPLVFDLTYANVVAITTNTVTIPAQDPSIRFRNGAYVQPQIKVLA